MPLSMQEMERRRALDEIVPPQHLLRLFGGECMVHISEASADTSRIELRNRAGHDGRSKTSRISSSCCAHRTRLLARDDIPCRRSAMPQAIPPEMESSGACPACSFMPSAEGMKGILRSRMTARAKMAKASEGDRPISRHTSVNSLSRSSSLSTAMAMCNPISGRCIYRMHRWHLSNVSFAGGGRAEELLCQPYKQ